MIKINLKEKEKNGSDSGVCDMKDLSKSSIAAVRSLTIIDMSNNNIIGLTKKFAPFFYCLVKLDISQNNLLSLPDNFGALRALRELDLHNNELQHLPLSLSKCTFLKWLDLRNNPLVPSLTERAGPCLDKKQCHSCAKKIVEFLTNIQAQLDKEVEMRNTQLQNRREHQINMRQAAIADKKQTDCQVRQFRIKNKKNASRRRRAKKNAPKKMSCLSIVCFSLLAVTLVSSLAGILLYNYDKPKYEAALNYLERAWYSSKTILTMTDVQDFASSVSKSGYVLLSNVQAAYNLAFANVYNLYSTYLSEHFSQIGRAIYHAWEYCSKLIMEFF
ncbi:leucine-rich repeat-containing protein 59-like [Ctenocephalides felis]|uniref:leucine-rich repeat-containing protein 59-like n=1 Tax=Ctenocephalides felis TaxID=7515 RepID=UPI000E6E1629|nr:leucine-rich repeat-containing protein 59-like [Ctenocephalides felis]